MTADFFLTLPMKIVRGSYDFLVFWYVRGSKEFWRKEISFIKGIERDIGVLINLKLITQPIFGDYTRMGRIIGPIFRLGRVLIGLTIIFFSVLAVVALFVIWFLLPVVTLIMIFENLPYIFK